MQKSRLRLKRQTRGEGSRGLLAHLLCHEYLSDLLPSCLCVGGLSLHSPAGLLSFRRLSPLPRSSQPRSLAESQSHFAPAPHARQGKDQPGRIVSKSPEPETPSQSRVHCTSQPSISLVMDSHTITATWRGPQRSRPR
jgi:hypothetical protein